MSQITAHVLDAMAGKPAAGMALCLAVYEGANWKDITQSVTNADGRALDLLADHLTLDAGTYRVRFETEAYLLAQSRPVFYPQVDVTFYVAAGGEHYHIPLLLSSYSYSTYRGS